MSTSILRTCAAAALLGAAACGGSDGGPSYSSTVDINTATIVATDAASYATAVAEAMLDFGVTTDVPDGVAGAARPSYAERLIARLRAEGFVRAGRPDLAASPSPFRLAGTCVPAETGVDSLGDPIDTDHDSIPNDYKIDFGGACTDTEGEYSVTYSGYLRLRDLPGLFAYRLDAGNLKIRWTHLAEYEQFTLNGYETGTYTSAAISNVDDMDFGESWNYLTLAPPPEAIPSGTGGITWSVVATSTYDPDGTIAWGSPVPSGSFDLSADYRVRFSGTAGTGGYHFLVSTPTPLTIEASPCEGPVAGVLDGELNGDAEIGFTVTWIGCNTANVTTRGTSDATTVPPMSAPR